MKRNIGINKLCLLAVLGATSTSNVIYAQETGLNAEIGSSLNYSDNILSSADEFAEDDIFLKVNPELALTGGLGKQRFSVQYNGEYAKYSDNSTVDYTDHDISLLADLDHSARLSSEFGFNFRDKHEVISDVNQVFTDIDEFTRFQDKELSARVAYGTPISFGQFVLGYSHLDRDFTKNEQEFRSFSRDQLIGQFFYRISSGTRLLAEVVYAESDYSPDVGFVNLTNDYNRLQFGVEWALTNQLEGSVKLGYQDRDYADVNLSDIDGLAFEASLDWQITELTNYQLEAKRETVDSSLQTAGGSLRTTYAFNASHSLSELTKIQGSLGYLEDEVVGGQNRQDERYRFEIGIEYSVLRNVDVGVQYGFEKRSSSLAAAEFDSNSISLIANIYFD